MITINLSDSNRTDVSFLEEFYPHEYLTFRVNVPIEERDQGWNGEHYKFLNYMANLYEDAVILEGGTAHGMSCLSLANSPNTVTTYETNGGWGIQRWVRGVAPGEEYDATYKPGQVSETGIGKYANTTFKLKDINTETDETILKADLIFLDVDPHDGMQETVFFDRLRSMNYKGVVIADDIHLLEGMQNWWDSVPERKWDVTDAGHYSGTGVVDFGYNIESVVN